MACATSQTIDVSSSLIPPYENPPVKNAYVAYPNSACIRIYRHTTLNCRSAQHLALRHQWRRRASSALGTPRDLGQTPAMAPRR